MPGYKKITEQGTEHQPQNIEAGDQKEHDSGASTAIVLHQPQINTEASLVLEQFTNLYNVRNQSPSKWNKWCIRPLKGFLYLLALNSGVPFIAPAAKFATDKTLKFFFGASIYIGIGSISIWSLRNFFTYFNLISNVSSASKYSEIAILVGSLVAGTLSVLPGVFIALKYNPLWIIPLSVFYDITTNTISYNEIFRQLYNDKFCYRGQQELRDHKDRLIKCLQYGIDNNNCPESTLDQEFIVQELKHTIINANIKLQVHDLHPAVFKTGLNISKYSMGILLPLSWAIVSVCLVYSDIRKYLDFGIFSSGLIAGLTTIPSYFLEYLFGKSLVASFYSYMANLIYGVKTINPLFNYYPKATLISLITAMILLSCSFAGRAQVITDLFDEGSFRNFMLMSVSIGTILFKLSAAINNVFSIGGALLARYTNNYIFTRQVLFDKIKIILSTTKPTTIHALLPILSNNSERKNESSERSSHESTRLVNFATNSPSSFFYQKKTPIINAVPETPVAMSPKPDVGN